VRSAAFAALLASYAIEAHAQDSQGLWTHQDLDPGRMQSPPGDSPAFPADVRFGYAFELRDIPDIGLVNAHGGMLAFAPAIGEHVALELSFAFLATPAGELAHLFPRPAVGIGVMTNDGPVILAASALFTFAGYGEHVRDAEDSIVWRMGAGLAAGGTVTFAPFDVFRSTAFGFFGDARYQVALTARGLEHGPLVSAGLSFVERARVDR
jgi:hypothetical protein